MGNLKIVSGGADTGDELDLFYSRADTPELVKRYRGVEISSKTLANWSWSGKGPRWVRFGRRSVARGRDILAAIDAMLTDSNPPQAA